MAVEEITAPTVSPRVAHLRTRLALFAASTLVGIGLSVLWSEALGSVVTVGSLVLLIWTLHRFGRTGPD
jgi:hypothetical protein